MKLKRTTGTEERTILQAMVVDDIVCGRISARWSNDTFSSKWANIIGEWCSVFYKSYGRAPRKSIENLFEAWAAKSPDEAIVRLIEGFLVSLSSDYKARSRELNSDYVSDLAGKHINKVRLMRTVRQLDGMLDRGDVTEAEKVFADYTKVEIGMGSGRDFFSDETAMKIALEHSSENLIEYDEALKHFFDDILVRDSFVSILAPEKRGKSFWLVDLAWQAVLQRRKVAFFSVGDMSENQMLKRFAHRMTGYPKKPGKLVIPKGIMREPGERNEPEIQTRIRKFDTGLTTEVAQRAMRHFRAKGLDKMLKVSTHPNSTLTVMGVESILKQWEKEGWLADVVVIDYADIMAMPDGGSEHRHQVNALWKQLRRLSQVRKILLITATQSDAASHHEDLLSTKNFTEDKRKLAHVTGMFGLNQTRNEKKAGLYRLNWIVLRDSEFDSSKVVYVAGNLAQARPAICSCF